MQPNPIMILSFHQREIIDARLNELIRRAFDADAHGRHRECERLNDRHDALFIAVGHLDAGTADAADLRLVCEVLEINL